MLKQEPYFPSIHNAENHRMSISLTDDFRTAAELSEQTDEILGHLRQTGGPIAVTVNGKPEAVLLSAKQYERMLHLVSLSRLLNEAEEDVRAGRVRPAEVVLKELGSAKKVPSRVHRKR